jgi:hypothetical protein
MGLNQIFSDKNFGVYPQKPSVLSVYHADKPKKYTTTKILQEICQSMASKFDTINKTDVINIGRNVGLRAIRVAELFGGGVYLTRAGELLQVEEDNSKHAITPIGLIDISVNIPAMEELSLQLIESARIKFALSWREIIKWHVKLTISHMFYPP